jgi:hypothetical protein
MIILALRAIRPGSVSARAGSCRGQVRGETRPGHLLQLDLPVGQLVSGADRGGGLRRPGCGVTVDR